MNAIVPVPRVSVSIRPAVAGDLAFVDRLAQMHNKAVGFMPTKQLEGKIAAGHILIAEDETRLPIGYCISQDRYFKRDDVGIVYAMNIAPGQQRKLVGATLLKAVFDRAAYGCKLFCCWCAQDLAANHFWESLGFIPLAFRSGAVGKKTRTHIFWQRRIREGDATTPYWYPCKTDGGAMREDRLVCPIPPGVKWSDEMPVLLPQHAPSADRKQLPVKQKETPKLMPPTRRGARFGPPSASPLTVSPEPVVETAKPSKPKREKAKVDPVHLAKARELRDRYLEQFNSGVLADGINALPSGKYEVSRAIASQATAVPALPPLPAAA